MSDYLVTQVMGTSNVDVRLQSRVTDGHAETRLQALTIEHTPTGRRDPLPTAALFVMIGAEPRTEWLKNVVALDEHGNATDKATTDKFAKGFVDELLWCMEAKRKMGNEMKM